MKENDRSVIYCQKCGKENASDATVCRECGESIPQKEHAFRDFLSSHIKEGLKDKASGKIFDVIKNWLLSHLFASVVTVTLIAVAATGVAAVSGRPRQNKVSNRPVSLTASILSPAEQALFENNNKHQVFYPEEFDNVWRPAALKHTIESEKDSCYGWVIVRNMELDANTAFDGYSELYICPGVTLTINGVLKEQKDFTDFYVAKGATLVINGDVAGGANICNDGTTIINGNYDAGSGQLTCNRGDITVNGEMTGALDIFSFAGATVTGIDHTDNGIRYYDFDASDLYEGVTGMNGMFVAVGSLD